MPLVLVEVPNEEALERLRQQADVQVVGIITPPAPVRKPSIAGLVGSLSDGSAERMRTETSQLRSEWERQF